MLPEKEIATLLKLSTIKNIGETTLKNLISQFPPLSKIFDVSTAELSKLWDKEFINTIREVEKQNIEPKLAILKKLGINIVTFEDTDYPENLKILSDVPPVLYICGKILPDDDLSIAIIGARRSTNYGKSIAERFAAEFATSGVTIVSGLARGIDTYAHKGALDVSGRTIAVLGSGIDVIYPPENHELYKEICDNGAVISEFPLGTQPWAGNFPARNRLISGLSKAIVVVEASLKSGVFSTVEWALNQGKTVFAVPGNITSETSKGTNQLIKDGAIPATSANDVLEYLGIKSISTEKKITLSDEDNALFNLLSYDPIHIDKLAELFKAPVPKVLSILLNLELQGVVKQLSGRNFVKNI